MADEEKYETESKNVFDENERETKLKRKTDLLREREKTP